MAVRPAVESDIPEITAIFNEIVRTSTAVYQEEPFSIEDRTDWWRAQQQKSYPLLVAEEDGGILGFASYGDFRPRPGYRFTVEGTLHLREGARRQGLGTQLLRDLIQLARAQGKHMMIAGVDAENTASRRFMEKMGGVQAGCLKEVGYKFGRYLDLVFYQIRL